MESRAHCAACAGNLPLCVGVVAGMIRASKDTNNEQDAVREVLAILQDDAAGGTCFIRQRFRRHFS